MNSRRPARLGSQIKDETSLILTEGLRDPRIGFVTVTDVKLSPDLKHARIYVSVLGSDREKKDTLEGLNHAAGYVRHLIGERLRLRRLPDITFAFDESIEYGDRIEKLLETVRSEPKSDED